MVARDYKVEVSGKLFDVKVIGEAGAGGAAPAAGGKKPPKRERKAGGGGGPPARRCPRRCREPSSKSTSSRAPRWPRAT